MSANEIGHRLKKARLDAGLTQKDVATSLGITYQAISNYERGINRVDTDTLARLCGLYSIEISDLLRTPAWDDNMVEAYRNAESDKDREYFIKLWGCPADAYSTPTLAKDHVDLSSEDIELIEKFHKLDRRSQIFILDMVNRELENKLFYEDLFKDSDIFEAAVEEAKRELLRQRDDWDD